MSDNNTKWQRLGQTLIVNQVFDIVSFAGLWILRTANQVIGCRAGASEAEWQVNLDKGQRLIGPKLLALAGGVVVTVEDFGYKRPINIIGINPKNGEVVWQQQIEGKLALFGLALLHERIWLHVEKKNQSSSLVQLDPVTGLVLSEDPSQSANGIRVAANKLFIPSDEGLYVMDYAGSTLRQLTQSHAKFISADGEAVYFYEESATNNGPLKIMYLNGASEHVVGQVECLDNNAAIERIIHLSEPGHVAVLHYSGFLIIDLQQVSIVADTQLTEGQQALSMVWTPHGLALACIMPDYNSKVLLYDNKTIAVLGELPVEELSPAVLFYIDDHLIVSGIGGIAFFNWGDTNISLPTEGSEVFHIDPTTKAEEINSSSQEEQANNQQKQLSELIDLFVSCMQADFKSSEHLNFGKKFNSQLDLYLQEHQSESVTTFALRVSKIDLPYEEVLQDVIYVRGLGSE